MMMVKKKYVIFLILVLCLLSGCGKKETEAKNVVVAYCEAMKDIDIPTMKSYVEYDSNLDQFFQWTEDKRFVSLLEQIREVTQKTKVHIKHVDMDRDGDSAMVTVKFTYIDLSKAGAKVLWNAVTDGIALAIGNNGEDAYIKLLSNSFKEVYKDMKKSKKTVEAIFHVEKVDGNWKIVQNPSEISEVAFCNVLGFFDSIMEMLPMK